MICLFAIIIPIIDTSAFRDLQYKLSTNMLQERRRVSEGEGEAAMCCINTNKEEEGCKPQKQNSNHVDEIK